MYASRYILQFKFFFVHYLTFCVDCSSFRRPKEQKKKKNKNNNMNDTHIYAYWMRYACVRLLFFSFLCSCVTSKCPHIIESCIRWMWILQCIVQNKIKNECILFNKRSHLIVLVHRLIFFFSFNIFVVFFYFVHLSFP